MQESSFYERKIKIISFHPRASKTTPDSGSSDRRLTKTTLVNESWERSKMTITPEKKSSHRRVLMTTFIFMEFQSSTYEDFSGIPEN